MKMLFGSYLEKFIKSTELKASPVFDITFKYNFMWFLIQKYFFHLRLYFREKIQLGRNRYRVVIIIVV